MTTEEKQLEIRLETALLEFIERATKEPLSDAETSIVPAVAGVLVGMWRI